MDTIDRTPPILTLGQAAKATGVQKSTLSKALKSGKLSFIEKTSAGYKIDRSELFRVYPPQPQDTSSENSRNERLDTPPSTAEQHPGYIRLQVEVEALREKMATFDEERTRERQQLTDQIEKLERVNEEQRADFRQSLAALTDQRDKRAVEAAQKPAGWLDRMLGRVG